MNPHGMGAQFLIQQKRNQTPDEQQQTSFLESGASAQTDGRLELMVV